jgi:Uma2 family endonuclease
MLVEEAKRPASELERLRMSYEEYAEWAVEGSHTEWVDGEVIVYMPAKDVHQATLLFLSQLLDLFTRLLGLGRVSIAPFEMKLERSAREPDILFVAQKNLERWTEDRLTGPADLVVEIISASTLHIDRNDKFEEYQRAGVAEYWLIDPRPRKRRADFYALNEQSRYTLFATEDDDRVESHVVPGFWLRPEWLWQAHERQPLETFLEMRGIPAEQREQIRQLLVGGVDLKNE